MSDGHTSKSCVRAPSAKPKPGDFRLGSAKSRAAARALIQERNRPAPSPFGTVNLSFLSVDRAREIYAKIRALPSGDSIDTEWFRVRWPDGFTPGDPPNADG